ncbi:hypothetical protein Fleli_1657 [Bernardetia litoralis DSM 6794]|uniref:STAS/SEC14 domain-containing protein n=1 Tax=Bernardetia litoralis (strain ATCC 23117 / DSM 6794 / NBRC 15988 / NCIMB 1366 / Fx l1 / Sio-4) TaxID=880071 RepID=I4AJD2_BERLS|nr:hypothetical protein [Bernardetia litoralis]AFM04067.1 hypothetical protein Fleli_1657 [Bernardetia litoralis DSM 6794]
MSKESLYKQSNVEVSYDTDNSAIYIYWKGFVMLDDFKDAMLKALDFYTEKKALHWIIDQTERQAVHPKVNEWVLEEFYPKLLDATQKDAKMAVIVPKDVFGRFSMKNQTEGLTKKFEEMIPYQYFQSFSEVVRWLS